MKAKRGASLSTNYHLVVSLIRVKRPAAFSLVLTNHQMKWKWYTGVLSGTAETDCLNHRTVEGTISAAALGCWRVLLLMGCLHWQASSVSHGGRVQCLCQKRHKKPITPVSHCSPGKLMTQRCKGWLSNFRFGRPAHWTVVQIFNLARTCESREPAHPVQQCAVEMKIINRFADSKCFFQFSSEICSHYIDHSLWLLC